MTLYEFFSLLGGVGLFLYGMTIMSTGLRNACGERLKTILEYATKNEIISVLVGIAVTMLIQSSSATDVMVIGFVNSGLMNLSQAIGVIMGANIGTTVTAQITAFNISAYAPVILFVGAVMYLFMGKPMVKHVGCVIMGFADEGRHCAPGCNTCLHRPGVRSGKSADHHAFRCRFHRTASEFLFRYGHLPGLRHGRHY